MSGLAGVAAWVAAHKVVLGVGGAVGVAGVAYARSHAKASTASSSTGTSAGTAYSSGAQTSAATGGTGYDSSSSDVYNALQPELESITSALANLSSTIPVPATTTTAATATQGTTLPVGTGDSAAVQQLVATMLSSLPANTPAQVGLKAVNSAIASNPTAVGTDNSKVAYNKARLAEKYGS